MNRTQDIIQFYAGVGSRGTPDHILNLMTALATQMSAEGWILRSGHAPGADQAFERGAGMNSEIFLPWPSFEDAVPINTSVFFDSPTPEAYEIAARFHPGWDHLRHGAKSLHARNVHQILGPADCVSRRSACVICWTVDGSLDGQGRASGGTGQALRIASHYGIPVYNLSRIEHYEKALEKIS